LKFVAGWASKHFSFLLDVCFSGTACIADLRFENKSHGLTWVNEYWTVTFKKLSQVSTEKQSTILPIVALAAGNSKLIFWPISRLHF
jgi:hypothetical protein